MIAPMTYRRAVLLSFAGLAGAIAVVASSVPAHYLDVADQVRLALYPAPPPRAMPVFARAEGDGEHFVAAKPSEIGLTVIHDAAYVTVTYPGGNVCTDVIIVRASAAVSSMTACGITLRPIPKIGA
jgi:hypothetical protein